MSSNTKGIGSLRPPLNRYSHKVLVDGKAKDVYGALSMLYEFASLVLVAPRSFQRYSL